MIFGSWVLNEIWIIHLSAASVGVLMSLSKLFFFKQSSSKLRLETVIGVVLCYSHQGYCLLYYLCEITSNNGIHIFLSHGCNCCFGFGETKAQISGFAYPYSLPLKLIKILLSNIEMNLDFFTFAFVYVAKLP